MKKQMLIATSIIVSLSMTACLIPSPNVNSDADKDIGRNVAMLIEDENSNPDGQPGNPDNPDDPGSNSLIAVEEFDSLFNKSDDKSWMNIYADFLENKFDEIVDEVDADWRNSWTIGFIFLNDDYIPEMIISSGYEAAGSVICTINDSNEVDCFNTSRLNIYYYEFGNMLDNAEGHMGFYYDSYAYIDGDGFVFADFGTYYDEMDKDYNYTGETIYAWNDTSVTEKEYEENTKRLIPVEERVYWNAGCSYDDTINFLKGNVENDYREAYSKAINDGSINPYFDYPYYALIEREGNTPLLVASNEDRFCICSFEEGLIQVGPDWYYSDYEEVYIYKQSGIIRNVSSYYEGKDTDISDYEMKCGSIISTYAIKMVDQDDDYNDLLDENGDLVYSYRNNGAWIDEKAFDEYEKKFEGEDCIQLVSPPEAGKDLKFYSKNEILELLAASL